MSGEICAYADLESLVPVLEATSGKEQDQSGNVIEQLALKSMRGFALSLSLSGQTQEAYIHLKSEEPNPLAGTKTMIVCLGGKDMAKKKAVEEVDETFVCRDGCDIGENYDQECPKCGRDLVSPSSLVPLTEDPNADPDTEGDHDASEVEVTAESDGDSGAPTE